MALVDVHYAKAPLVGDVLLPWKELTPQVREVAGHAGRVHEGRSLGHYRDDVVYFHRFPEHMERRDMRSLGLGYCEGSFGYEVAPAEPVESDPEPGHPYGSCVAPSARILRLLWTPDDPA